MKTNKTDHKRIYLMHIGEISDEYAINLENLSETLNAVLQRHEIPIYIKLKNDSIPLLDTWYDPEQDNYWASRIILYLEEHFFSPKRSIIGIVDGGLNMANPFESYYGTYSPSSKYNNQKKCTEYFGVALVSSKEFKQAGFSERECFNLLAKLILKFIGHIFGIYENCPYECLMRSMHDIQSVDNLPLSYCKACSSYLKGEKLILDENINEFLKIALEGRDLNIYVKKGQDRYKKVKTFSSWQRQVLFVDSNHKVHPWKSPLDSLLLKRSPLEDYNRLIFLFRTWANNGYEQSNDNYDQTIPPEVAIPILKELAIAGDFYAINIIKYNLIHGNSETVKFSLKAYYFECLNPKELENLILKLVETKNIFKFIDCFENVVSSQSSVDEEDDYDGEPDFEEQFWDYLNDRINDMNALEKKLESTIIDAKYDESELFRIKNYFKEYTPIPCNFLKEPKNSELQKEDFNIHSKGEQSSDIYDIHYTDEELAEIYEEISKEEQQAYIKEISSHSIEDVLESKSRVNILKALTENVDPTISLIIKQTSLGYNIVRKNLDYLKALDLVQIKKFGRINMYRYNIENPMAEKLKNLVDKEEYFDFKKYEVKELQGELLNETEKALLIRFDSGKEIWLPKSTITSYNKEKKKQSFIIDSWILEKNGI